jgi:hypothetical protein
MIFAGLALAGEMQRVCFGVISQLPTKMDDFAQPTRWERLLALEFFYLGLRRSIGTSLIRKFFDALLLKSIHLIIYDWFPDIILF